MVNPEKRSGEAREFSAEECGVNGTDAFEERLGIDAVKPARKRYGRVIERKRIRLEVVRAEMRGPFLIQDVAQGVVEHIDIRRAQRIEPESRTVNTKEGCVVPSNPPAATPTSALLLLTVLMAPSAVSASTVRRTNPAVVEQPLAPRREVLVPCTLDHGQRRFADHVSTGNRLDGHERGGNDGPRGQRRDEQRKRGDTSDGVFIFLEAIPSR